MPYTKHHEGKHYVVTPEKSVYHIQAIFGYTRFQTPEIVTIKVKTQESPDSIYFIADIETDLVNTQDRIVSFENTEKGTQVFVRVQGSTVSAPVGFLVE
jgi:hypothetical protein